MRRTTVVCFPGSRTDNLSTLTMVFIMVGVVKGVFICFALIAVCYRYWGDHHLLYYIVVLYHVFCVDVLCYSSMFQLCFHCCTIFLTVIHFIICHHCTFYLLFFLMFLLFFISIIRHSKTTISMYHSRPKDLTCTMNLLEAAT